MDGVLADFDQGFINKWVQKYPDKPYVPKEKRFSFYIRDDYPKELKELIQPIMAEPGFYYSMPPMKGGLEAAREMENIGFEVFLCTSPLVPYANCVKEKFEWVDRYFGERWVKKIILTKDKTVVHGNKLIDDKPEITGVQIPTWEHILYTQPYNKHIKKKRRLTWDDWTGVLSF